MPERRPGKAVGGLLASKLLRHTLPLRPENEIWISDACAGDAAIPTCGHACHNYTHTRRNICRAAGHNNHYSRCHDGDLHNGHSRNLDRDDSCGCFHGGVRGIRYAGRHGDLAPWRVVWPRRSIRSLRSKSVFSFRSPQLALPCRGCNVIPFHMAAEHGPNDRWTHYVHYVSAFTRYRSPPVVRLEASAREEVPACCESGPRRGLGPPLPGPRRNITGKCSKLARAGCHRQPVTSVPVSGQILRRVK